MLSDSIYIEKISEDIEFIDNLPNFMADAVHQHIFTEWKNRISLFENNNY